MAPEASVTVPRTAPVTVWAKPEAVRQVIARGVRTRAVQGEGRFKCVPPAIDEKGHGVSGCRNHLQKSRFIGMDPVCFDYCSQAST